ncbi:porin [Methylophilaceae bacterium]|nr:porin [Methylophilaceae bacterium]|tara:strand:+ start:37 stop:1260 length:1224 start_codon:yes stop_codon:yes gene_type:complete
MNNKIKLAVAGAVLASASVANAGITWDAGEWTVDMNGNVNAFAILADNGDTATIQGKMTNSESNDDTAASINTGLLPSWLGFTATTRQNDLDTSVTISFQPGASTTGALAGGGGSENRQAFLTFGDKSWGSVKVGKDLGIFGSTAILNDMTLLGVGSQGVVGSSGGTTTTLGRIGTGYIYADWNGQIAYTTPNMNGFSATVGVMQPWNVTQSGVLSATSAGNTDEFGFQGQASYSWTGDFAGKVWAGFFTQEVTGMTDGAATPAALTSNQSDTATAYEAGVSATVMNINLVAYGYSGDGVGTTGLLRDGYATDGESRDSDGYYAQATYVIPMGTKLGVSYGESKLDLASGEAASALVKENEMLTIGAYHPLTKHLNLVAEYSDVESKAHDGASETSDIFTVGAILFF